MTATLGAGPACPVPLVATDRIQLGHGSGGKMSAALLRDRFLPHFSNAALAQLGDAAVLPVHGGEVAISTDTFVVHPVEFPGGNIGSLSVHGTLNDLAMMGARPLYLTAGFVLEEGLDMALLDRIVVAMAQAADAAGPEPRLPGLRAGRPEVAWRRDHPAERARPPAGIRRLRRRAALRAGIDGGGGAGGVPRRRGAAWDHEAARLPCVRHAVQPGAPAGRADGLLGRGLRGVLAVPA